MLFEPGTVTVKDMLWLSDPGVALCCQFRAFMLDLAARRSPRQPDRGGFRGHAKLAIGLAKLGASLARATSGGLDAGTSIPRCSRWQVGGAGVSIKVVGVQSMRIPPALQTPAARRLLVAGLIVLIGLVHVVFWRAGHVWGDDFAQYILHAKNLAEGKPYEAIGYLYNPNYPAIGPPTYPPGLPILLAPIYGLFGLNLPAMKTLILVSFLLFLGAMYACFRRELSFGEAFGMVALVGLNHFFLDDTNAITSDLPFLALFYAAILAIQKAEALPLRTWQRFVGFVAAAVIVYAAYATRSLGALLIPALLLKEFLGDRRITASALAATAVFAALALVQAMAWHSDRHYLDQIDTGRMALVFNAFRYATRVGAFCSNGYLKPVAAAIALVVTWLAAIGFIDRVRHKLSILETLSVIYLSVILAWPSYQGQRYLYPLVPIYVFYAMWGLRHPWLAQRVQVQRALAWGLAAAIALSYAACYTTIARGPLAEGVAKRESQELFAFIREQTEPDAVIVFIKPRAMASVRRRPITWCARTGSSGTTCGTSEPGMWWPCATTRP